MPYIIPHGKRAPFCTWSQIKLKIIQILTTNSLVKFGIAAIYTDPNFMISLDLRVLI